MNVIPDDYEYSNYDDEYDPNDIPEDQAAPLPGYGGDDLGELKSESKIFASIVTLERSVRHLRP